MLGTDLTSVSTFGWYQDESIVEQLTPISTFGWYYTQSVVTIDDGDIISVGFCLHRIVDFQLTR